MKPETHVAVLIFLTSTYTLGRSSPDESHARTGISIRQCERAKERIKNLRSHDLQLAKGMPQNL